MRLTRREDEVDRQTIRVNDRMNLLVSHRVSDPYPVANDP